jgi:hypothetical protein
MRERDFVLFDIAQIVRRDYDDAITEIDLVIVPVASPLRANSTYKAPAQVDAALTLRRRKFGLF